MLILKGAQGLGKSTFFRLLCNDNEKYYEENLENIEKSFDKTNGRWFVEMAELDSFNKNEITRIKAYITQRSERHRIPYQPTAKDYLRQFVLIGTTNEGSFLVDNTGNRRFVIVECTNDKDRNKLNKSVFDKTAKKDIEQILAEAFYEYKSGKKFLVVPEEFNEEVEIIQNKHSIDDPDKGIIEEFLKNKERTCLLQIWMECLGHRKIDRFPKSDKNRIAKIIEDLPNWRLYEGNSQNKARIKGNILIGYKDGYPQYNEYDYGIQKSYEKFIPKEILENKKKKEITDIINDINGTNISVEDMWL